MIQIIDKLIESSNKKHIILEYSLLTLMKYFDMCDFKILVTASDDVRLNRVINRDKINEEYFKNREKHSLTYNPNDFDFIFENNANDKISIDGLINEIKNKEQLWLEKQQL